MSPRTTDPESRTVAIVLAGGGATRLEGTAVAGDKTRLEVAGSSSLDRVLRAAPAAHLVVVGPEGQDGAALRDRHGCRFVREDPAGAGPLAALARGVEAVPAELVAAAQAGEDVRVLLLAGDMPLLRPATLRRLGESSERVGLLVDADGRDQILCASWPLTTLRDALAATRDASGSWTDQGIRRLYAALPAGALRRVPATGAESTDLDTAADVEAARAAAGPRIALVQVRIREDVRENLATVRRRVGEAAAAGARVVVLPEATLTPFGTDLRAAAEKHHDEFVTLLEELGETHGVTIVAGSFTPADPGRVHNTLVARGGGVRAEYRKLHLFDAYGAEESRTVAPGDEVVTIEVDGTVLGLATCYDVRFPALFAELARRGAQAVLLPMAWGDGEGKVEALRLLLRARALDATTPVLAADQAPPEVLATRAPRGVGHSAAVDALGRVEEDLGREEGMLLVDLDLAAIRAAREALPVLQHARPLT